MTNIFANITNKTSFNIMIKILTETQLDNINIQNQLKFHSLTFISKNKIQCNMLFNYIYLKNFGKK